MVSFGMNVHALGICALFAISAFGYMRKCAAVSILTLAFDAICAWWPVWNACRGFCTILLTLFSCCHGFLVVWAFDEAEEVGCQIYLCLAPFVCLCPCFCLCFPCLHFVSLAVSLHLPLFPLLFPFIPLAFSFAFL